MGIDQSAVRKNDGWGIYAAAATGAKNTTFGTWTHPNVYANASGGIGVFGRAGATVNDLVLTSVIASSDGGDEIRIDPFGGSNIKINGCFAELAGQERTGRDMATAASHTGHGIMLGGGGTSGAMNISACIAQHNAFEGLYVEAKFTSVSITGFQSLSNALNLVNGFVTGINLYNASTNYSITAASSYNDGFEKQSYGLFARNADNVFISASDFSNNAKGGCIAEDGSFVSSAVRGSGCTGAR